MQTYDPHRLVDDVRTVLEAHGLAPNVAPGQKGQAVSTAGQLLRTLGITPAMDPVEALARAMDKPWTEIDER
ncbi:hypothetical protein MTP10_40825 [Nonomuraea sp. 3-1Str]|uniref:hypothetical protein n=1 Tax=Nonomuraea sp. 3-1Str TaxID=2929801 RepID=UPI00285BDF74|nr:hypothetical protein [Nonomuraea sp. 3-1Str]MDR8415062.1 hypothetical protein [Nonomuraea sp. 3-1Str]